MPTRVVSVDVPAVCKTTGESVETAARRLRYDALRNELSSRPGFRYIATAHNRDDAAETVLFRLLRGCGTYDLLFLDPPYDSGLTEKALEQIKAFDILSNGGIIICETRAETELSAPEPPYFLKKEYRYGKVKLTTYTKEM